MATSIHRKAKKPTSKEPRKFFEVRLRIEGERGETVAKFIDQKIQAEHRASRSDAVTAFLLESAIPTSAKQIVPFQCCPKCSGQGIVSKPSWVAGDVNTWSDTTTSHVCDVCIGMKIIPMHFAK